MDKRSIAPPPSDRVISEQLGVWRILVGETPSAALIDVQWETLIVQIRQVIRLFKEIYNLGPGLFILVILGVCWSGIKDSLLLYFASRLLTIIEVGLKEGKPDMKAICVAAVARLICTIVSAIVDWTNDYIQPVLKTRATLHFEEHLMQARLNIDVPSLKDNTSQINVTASSAWEAFTNLLRLSTSIVSMLTQTYMVLVATRSTGGGILFGAVCIGRWFLEMGAMRMLWLKSYAVYANNDHYIRMLSLKELADDEYKQDIISGYFIQYILDEYRKARKMLGDTLTEDAEQQYRMNPSPAYDMLDACISDFPMVYYAANAILYPSKFSVASIAILQHSFSELRWSLYSLQGEINHLRKSVNDIKNLYEVENIGKKISGGLLPYPASAESSQDGMSIELRDVSFVYPESKSSQSALKNVSFSIKAGQLVVIVGVNGSGKSTLIKLLSHLYDPSSGDVLIDGHEIQKYQIPQLRKATAMLAQDHNIFPLSVSENIGLGYPSFVSDSDMLVESAKLGGSYDFISKLTDGFDTILHPVKTGHSRNVTKAKNPNLLSEYEKIEKSVELSGGEKQRLIASRTFIRLNSGEVKLVVVDEPSSALDPEAEWELFQNLRERRAGKTMVFVTHRFGHLTKFADVILCMKEGVIAESGTHQELMDCDGEYAKLYNIQAQAFATNTTVE